MDKISVQLPCVLVRLSVHLMYAMEIGLHWPKWEDNWKKRLNKLNINIYHRIQDITQDIKETNNTGESQRFWVVCSSGVSRSLVGTSCGIRTRALVLLSALQDAVCVSVVLSRRSYAFLMALREAREDVHFRVLQSRLVVVTTCCRQHYKPRRVLMWKSVRFVAAFSPRQTGYCP